MSRTRYALWALAGFGAAFGLLEAAVVVDLRRLLDPAGTLFPRVVMPPELLRIELLREVSTLVILAIVAHLAAGDRTARFAAFLYVFGVWDLAYYAALWRFMGWPPGLATWDLLFLIPRPWFGPVYAPMLVALVLVACGTLALWRIGVRGVFPVRARHVAGAALGGALVLASFLEASPDGGPPERYRVELCLAGLAVGIVAFADAFRRAGGAPPEPGPASLSSEPQPARPRAARSSIAGVPTSTAPGPPARPPRAGS